MDNDVAQDFTASLNPRGQEDAGCVLDFVAPPVRHEHREHPVNIRMSRRNLPYFPDAVRTGRGDGPVPPESGLLGDAERFYEKCNLIILSSPYLSLYLHYNKLNPIYI